jgi:hypothetical protein
MVPSFTLAIVADGERPSFNAFSLGETIHFGSLEFITDRFGGLSLSPPGDGSDATVMGSTHSRPPSPLRAMTGNSVEEFHMDSDEEGRTDLCSLRRLGTGASTAPVTTIPWSETALTAQAMTTILPRQAASRHEPQLGEERILMMVYAPVQAMRKGEAPTASRDRGQAAAKALNASSLPTIDGADKLYRPLAEIHAIAATQLAECARWRESDQAPSPVWVEAG